jgi:HSP20 family protein
MTLVKFNPFAPTATINRFQSLDRILNDVFNTPVFRDEAHGTTPSVNVLENDENFKLEVAAPGLAKDDFKLNIEDDVLTISSEKKVEKHEEGEKIVRKEFAYSTFKRTFTLPDTVNIADIKAAYENGVLTVTLPKQEVKKTTQTITVS